MSEWRERLSDDSIVFRETDSDGPELRRCVRDLAALSALPAQWRDYDPVRIAESAGSVLAPMLDAAFVYVGLPHDRDMETIDVVKVAGRPTPGDLEAVAAMMKLKMRQPSIGRGTTIVNPIGGERLRLAIAPIGLEGTGVIVAGAEAATFPTETQQVLLEAAANATALSLQRWRRETEMGRFVSIVECSSDFVGLADVDGTTRYINPAGLGLVGLRSLQQVPSQARFLEFLAPEDRPRARNEAWPTVMESGRWLGELAFRHFTTGAAIPFLVDLFRIDESRTGKGRNIAAVCRDLRGQKRSELDKRHLNETLERRVLLRTAELADANRKLVAEVAERARLDARLREAHVELGYASRLSAAGQMAAALAHELNQPLTAIANSMGVARRSLASGAPEAIDSAGAVMDEAIGQSLRAGQIISRIRNFIARGETEARVENVAAMIEEASALALIGSDAAGVEMCALLDPGAPLVLANRVEIQQVLINLMRNALEAMAGMDQRLLRLTTELKRPDVVEFAVADTGPGIDVEIADRIFEPFVTTKRNGMGIGLAVCRSIIERHGGSLRFGPHAGGGTIFTFTLRAPPSDGAPGAA